MPMPTTIPLTPGSLPPGYCFSSWGQLVIDIFTGAFGTIPGSLGIGFNYGPDIPGVDDQGKPWIRTDVSGGDLGTWTFGYGRWTKKHPVPASSDMRQIWVGTLANLYAFDGGDGIDPTVTPPTQVTGSFWEQDTAFAARTIVGVGTLPVSTTVLAVGDTGGLDQVKLTLEEMFPHTHTPQAEEQAGKPANKIWGSDPAGGAGTGNVYPNNDGLAGVATQEVPINTTLANAGGDTSATPPVDSKPHENMPPYVAVYVVKRTARAYYTV